MFDVGYSNQSKKFLKKADDLLRKRLINKIEIIKQQPVIHDSKSVEGYEGKFFRVRVGDYRILYEVDYKNNKLGIVKIDKRPRAY